VKRSPHGTPPGAARSRREGVIERRRRVLAVIWGAVAVIITGLYPERAQRFLVGAYRYVVRVEAYVGNLTDRYAPFRMAP
jgi:hypothetical protein